VSGKSVKAPMPGRAIGAKEAAEARGFADSAALRLRHHNERLHVRHAPADEVARAVFDAVEQARVEALGARGMAGVRANLSHLAEMRLKTDPLVRARSREEVPLGSALGLIVRERLTGEGPPEAAREGLALVSGWIEERAGADLDALGLAIDDQAAFAALATKLLRDLENSRKKLRNQDFLAKARPDIVEREKQHLAMLEENLDKLRRAQESLKAVHR